MTFLVSFIHIVVCLFLIIVVLLQSGKAADLAGAFGGMGSQTTFGPRGSATVLSTATTWSAALFMATSLTLTILATRGGTNSALPQGTKQAPGPVKSAPPANSIPVNIPPQATQPPPQPAPAPAKK